MKARLLPVVYLAVVIAAAPLILAQDQGRSFHWSGKLAPENVIEIKNINGDIEARPTGGDSVDVTAEKSGPQADQVKIEVAQRTDGVTICVVYPSMHDDGHCEQMNNHGHTDAKVMFHLQVPSNIRFSGKNVNGTINAEDLGRVIHAETVNGSIHASTKSWVEASSVNGSIEAAMGKAGWNGTLRIATVNGSIHLTLPGDTDSDVDFKSVNGRLDSDFPLTVQGRMGGHSVSGTIGSGGRELKLETVNGGVELRRGSI